MLRECRRVLKPGGKLAGYVIHAAPGLTEAELAMAAEAGPSDIVAVGAPSDRAARTGFDVIHEADVTQVLRSACETILALRSEHETALRAEETDPTFEEECAKKRAMIEGIDNGLIRRSVVVAVK